MFTTPNETGPPSFVDVLEHQEVDENMTDVLDKGPTSVPNSPKASPQPLGHRVRHLPQRFRDLLPSNPILLQQYSEADAQLQIARDEARCRRLVLLWL